MRRISLVLIAAVARNRVIGDRGAMPWRLATDLRRFRSRTLGHPVVMGRRTFEALGRPLGGRRNIVVTRQPAYAAEGAEVASSPERGLEMAEAAARADGRDAVFVIGGGELYRATIGHADRLDITHVLAAPEGDAHFPPIDPAVWRAVSRESVPAGPEDSEATEFVVYERVAAPARRRDAEH